MGNNHRAKFRRKVSAQKRLTSEVRTILKKHVNNVYEAGKTDRKQTRNWTPDVADANYDTLSGMPLMRARSRDLYSNDTIAASAIESNVLSVIGSGLRLNASVDYRALKITPASAADVEKAIEEEFRIFAESPDCDAYGINTFYDLQEQAFRNYLLSGDDFTLLPYKEKRDNPYTLSIQMIEADRVSTPGNMNSYVQSLFNANLESKNKKIIDGVEITEAGTPVAYHIKKSLGYTVDGNTWKRVPKYGRLTNRLQVIHLYKQLRPGQYRGVPLLAPVITQIKQISRYQDAELDAAVISALYTAFITTESGNVGNGLEPDYDDIGSDGNSLLDTDAEKENDYRLGTGSIIGLQEGEKVQLADPNRPNVNFGAFLTSAAKLVGAAINTPASVLLKDFQKSYSAARAELLNFWLSVNTMRAFITRKWITPIYNQFLDEAVLNGRLNLPGYNDDINIRTAYRGAQWLGQALGQIDPNKETKAALLRMSGGITTGQKESSMYDGSSYEDNLRQISREQEERKKLGIKMPEINILEPDEVIE